MEDEKTMKKSLLIAASLVLAGCVSGGYSPRYFYNEIQVHNLSGGSISNVNLQVAETGRSLSCDQVNKNALCDDRFGRKYYPQAGIEISWTHPDGSSKSEMANPDIPAYFSNAFSLRVIVEILEDGSVKSYFEQEEPGRDGNFFMGSL